MTIYTTDNCIYCTMLKQRLDHQKIAYEEITDGDIINEKGFATVPQLDTGGDILDFDKAISYLNRLNGSAVK